MRTIAATLLYFAIVFGAGFILGPVRVKLLEPNLGAFYAILCEAPFLVAAMIFGARWVPGAVGMERSPGSLTWMGFGALLLVLIADAIVGVIMRGMTMSQWGAHFTTNEGLLYAMLLLAFATMPVHANPGSR